VYLLIGLGNPGKEYAFTRHNIGFRVIEELARRCGVRLKQTVGEALSVQTTLAGQKVVLACPLTYMNRSGVAVKVLLRHYSLDVAQLLVFYDDLDLPLGRLRLRPAGGSGGHRGMQSLIGLLATQNFPRLRLGVGRENLAQGDLAGEEAVADYLLTPFSAAEEEAVQDAVSRAAAAAELYLRVGLEAVMNRYNPAPD
jgi:PTH1 family peptidyl-tRNA hydrolase